VLAVLAASTLLMATPGSPAGCRAADAVKSERGPHETAPTQSRKGQRIRAALLDLEERDQAARAEMIAAMQKGEPLPGGGVQISDEAHQKVLAVLEIDAEATAFLKMVVDEHGWPGISLVGEDGASAAWLLAQHADADPEFQAPVLKLMEPLPNRARPRPPTSRC
jgi:hypothetical protein